MMNRLTRSAIGVAVFALAFVVNPLYFAGCVASDPEPNFGEPEMLALLDDANESSPYAFAVDDVHYELALSLSQSAQMARAIPKSELVQSAYACGNRAFYQSAAACVTVTELPVNGTFTLRRMDGSEWVEVATDIAVRGSIAVYGETLTSAFLTLHFRDNQDTIQLNASPSPFDLTNFNATNLGSESLAITYAAN
ncbi:MAG: hypothetical protein IPK60_11490 [Sandaracinaceae bacterium]|jgi:hypothetical protein|nr:hypothetical protein [Sandaracinaceae bacterium]